MQTLITLTSNQADLLLPYRKLLAARRFWREFHLFDRLRSKKYQPASILNSSTKDSSGQTTDYASQGTPAGQSSATG
ncbi:hypothetical protein BASA61_004826 [Batrachochytrium salamandrivorans]|nr:hypothetical protein BASA61_004826 [Batrachochytrium salamandrivorans]